MMLLGCIPKFDRSSQCTSVADCFKGERCDVIRGCVLVDDSGTGPMGDSAADMGAVDQGEVDLDVMDVTVPDAQVDQGTVDGGMIDASLPSDAMTSDASVGGDAMNSDLGRADGALAVDQSVRSADDGLVPRRDADD